ncbi:MAG: TM2 domain-containing protein [Flavobacteriales bacterium]|jgi:hypothetical protein|nr:TM2 domain-containing protein [Flavobacteriales bacterium]
MKKLIMGLLLFLGVINTEISTAAIPVKKTNTEFVMSEFVSNSKVSTFDVSELAEIQKINEEAIAVEHAKNDEKSWTIAVLLVVFLGILGIHRFYLGYPTIGIIQLLTIGGLGIWFLIDFIRVITRDLQPKNDSYKD